MTTRQKMLIWMLKSVTNLMIVSLKENIRVSKILICFFLTEEDEEENLVIPGVGPIAMHASNRDDPLLEIKDDVSFL